MKDNHNAFIIKYKVDEGKLKFALKDVFNVKDEITSAGSRILSSHVSDYDSDVFDALRKYFYVGKTNMDEFASGNTGTTSYYGKH